MAAKSPMNYGLKTLNSTVYIIDLSHLVLCDRDVPNKIWFDKEY